MDDRSIIERDGHQIEQIRELDLEELQVEEVDDAGDSSDDDAGYSSDGDFGDSSDDDAGDSSDGDFGDSSDDDGDRRAAARLDGGAIHQLPLLSLEGAVLFPGATLPLKVIQPSLVATIERKLSPIGAVPICRDPDLRLATTGTTVKITKCGRLEDGSLIAFARGQQRFRLRSYWTDADGVANGEVQIIQEDLPLRTPRDAFGKLPRPSVLRDSDISRNCPENSPSKSLTFADEDADSEAHSENSFESALSLSHSGDASGSGGQSHKGSWGWTQQKAGTSNYGLPRAFWPHWVYRMYDSYSLAQRVADMWKQIVGAPAIDDGLVKKPDLLSFHVASKIPVSQSTRQELLEIDGVPNRLRREIELLECFDRI